MPIFLLTLPPASQQLIMASKCPCDFSCFASLVVSFATGQILHLHRSFFVFPVGDRKNNRSCLLTHIYQPRTQSTYTIAQLLFAMHFGEMPIILISQKIVQNNLRCTFLQLTVNTKSFHVLCPDGRII